MVTYLGVSGLRGGIFAQLREMDERGIGRGKVRVNIIILY